MSVRRTAGSGVRLFVHCLAAQRHRARVAAAFAAPERFPDRALVLALEADVVCVWKPIEAAYLEFLCELGIGPAPERIVVLGEAARSAPGTTMAEGLLASPRALNRIAELVSEAADLTIDTFLTSDLEARLARRLEELLGRPCRVTGGDPTFVDRANHKHVVRERALELGVPVAPGETVELERDGAGRPRDLAALRAALERQRRRTGRAIVRGSYGSSGLATAIVGDGPGLQAALTKVAEGDDNRVYLVEAMLEVAVSPNVLLRVDPADGLTACVCASDQLLDESLGYTGNVFPSRAATLPRMLEAAQRLASWLRAEGYAGPAGFDFGEVANPAPDVPDFFLAELNLRTNGATYVTALRDRLDDRQVRAGAPRFAAFLATSLPATDRTFAELRARHASLLFDPATGRGFVPYNTGRLEVGAPCTAAFFGGSREEVLAAHEALTAGRRQEAW